MELIDAYLALRPPVEYYTDYNSAINDDHRFVAILMPRRTGKTTLLINKVVAHVNNNCCSSLLVIGSSNYAVRYMYDLCYTALTESGMEIISWSSRYYPYQIVTANGSEISFATQHNISNCGRYDYLLIDEAANIPYTFEKDFFSTVHDNGKIFMISTPKPKDIFNLSLIGVVFKYYSTNEWHKYYIRLRDILGYGDALDDLISYQINMLRQCGERTFKLEMLGEMEE